MQSLDRVSVCAGPIQNSNRLHSLEQAAPWKHLESQLLFPGGSKSRHHLLGEDMALVTDIGEGGAPSGYEGHMERAAPRKASSRHRHRAVLLLRD